jgi:hypothetical protein
MKHINSLEKLGMLPKQYAVLAKRMEKLQNAMQVNQNPDALYCFFDTNILLHFTTFDEVDWLKFLNAPQVYLMLTRPVLRELDKFKDDRTVAWRRNRARMLLSKIDGLLPQSATGVPVPTKDGIDTVFLLDIPREPDAEWIRKHALDPEVTDDRILACILQFQEQHPDRHIRFLSNDMSFRRNAIANSIDTIKPDGKELEQLEQRSLEEERIRELERELQDYKNSRPKLEFGFGNTQELTTTVISPKQGDDTLNAEVLSKAFTDEFVHRQFIEQQQHIARIINQSRESAPEYQFQEYVKACERYLKELEPALKRRCMQQYGNMCLLSFILKNVGTAPAEDLKIELHFPPGTLAIDADDIEEEIMIPDEPKAAWMNPPRDWLSAGGIISPGAFAIQADPTWRLVRAYYETQPRSRGPLCYRTKDSHIVTYTNPKLQHQDPWPMRPVVVFLFPDGKEGFSIRYSISADKLPKRKEGTLHVQWKRESAASGNINLREQILRRIES